MAEGAFPSDPVVDAPLSVAAPEPEDNFGEFPSDPIVDAAPTAPLESSRVPPYRAGQEPPVIPERQWSVFGTPLPGTEADIRGETIHPLSRAALQNFDLTSDIDSNRAAIEQVVAKTYPGLNREILSGYPDARLKSIIETPKLRQALALDSATRERLAKNAEEAAILRNEIPLMLAAEGAIATYNRMMMSAEDRTPEAMVKRRRDVNLATALVEAPIRTSIQTFWGIYGEAQSSALANQATYAGRPVAAFVNAFKEWSPMGGEQYALIPDPVSLVGKVGAGAGAAFTAGLADPEDAAKLSEMAAEAFNRATENIIQASKDFPLPKDVQALVAGLPKVKGFFDQIQTIAYLAANPVATAKWAAITGSESFPGIAAGGAATLLGQPALGLSLMTAFNAAREFAAINDPELYKSVLEKTGINLETVAGRAEYARNETPAARAARQESERFRTSRAVIISATSLAGIKIAGGLKPTRSMTLNVGRATGVNVSAEAFGELFAGRIATGEYNFQAALLEGILGSGPLMTTLQLGVAGRADALKRAETTKLEEWLRGNEEVLGLIANIPVEKLDTAASVLADKMAAEGNPDVFLSAENLLRFDQDGDAIGTLGLTREEVERAASEGQDVQIDAQTFIRHILGKDGFDSLIRHTTFEEGALTPDEAERSVEEGISIEAALNEKIDSMLGPELTKPVLDKLVEDASAIRSLVAEQIKATGRYDAAKSDAFALLTASRYTARAVRIARETGQPVDAAALFEADNLQIAGGQPAPSALQQALTGTGRVAITPAETVFFDEILGNEVNRSELIEAVPSLRVEGGELFVAAADIDAFMGEMDGFSRADGARTVPPRLRALTSARDIVSKMNFEQGRIRSVWDTIRGKDSSSSVVTLRHGGPPLEGGKLDLEFTGRANDPTSTSPRETTGVYFSTEGGTQATQFSSNRRGSRVRRLYEARLPAESLSGVVDFMSRVSDLSPEMQQTLADLAAEAGIEIGRGEIAGNLISSIRNELENGTELLVEAGISGHEKKLINEMVIWDQALLDSAELFDVTEGDPVQLRQDDIEQNAKEFGVSAEVLKAELDAVGGDITQTPRFKEWFGDSKVVDADGNPMVVYHGTDADIEVFDPALSRAAIKGLGVFLSSSPPVANTYATGSSGRNVIPAYASLKTPIVVEAAGKVWSQLGPDTVIRIPARTAALDPDAALLSELGVDGDRPARQDFAEQEVRISDLGLVGRNGMVTTNDIARWAKEQDGIDGIVFNDIVDRGPGMIDAESSAAALQPATNVLAFDPSQVKSVFNRGAFDPASDNILEQSAVDIFDTPLPVTPTGGKKGTTVLVKDIAAAFNDDHQTKFGRQLFPEESAEDYALVKEMAVDELRMALTTENNGLGWYAKDVQDAVQNTSLLYPTLLTEAGHKDYFLFMAGIFSNGTNPTQAWEMAAGAYDLFLADPDSAIPVERRNADGSPVAMTSFKDKKTGKKITKPAGWGVRGATNNQQLAVLKYLVEQEGSLESGVAWFLQEHPRDEINRVMVESGGFKAGRYKTKADRAGPPARGTDVLGPKLGNYTASLLGIEVSDQDTTIDKWYTRTYRRWAGRLFEAPLSNEGVADMPSPAGGGIERNTIFRLTGELSQEFNIGPEDVQAVLWFFEKRLWANHGASLDEGTNSNGAKVLLEKRGIDVPEGSLEQGASPAGTPTSALEQQRGAAGPRGGFTPSDLITDQEGNPVNLIQIFEKADPTTFLHESGHFWLEQLKADALAVGGGFQNDFKAVTDWWASRPLELREEAVRRAKKKKDKDSVAALQQMTEAQVSAYARSGELRGEGPSRYLSVAMHEQFARGVENYFATGRAPSLALGSIFSQFKVWVGSVYNRFMKLDVQFSPEVTGVVDRLLASDEEITVVEGQYNMAPLLQTAEQAGMTPTQFSAYQREVAEAGEARRAKQVSKTNRDHKRTLTKWWEDSEDAMRPEVEQEVAALPVYRLMYAITELGLADGSVLPDGEAVPRMDKAALAEVLEAEGYALADMPTVGSKTLYMEGGEAPAIVAAAFGYEDVISMIAELTAVAPYDDAVAAAVKARMEDRYGAFDSMYEAVDSAHIDKTAQVLAAELQALRTTEPAFKQKFVRQYARERLLDATTEEIRPFKYIQAEKKHADLAGAALKRGDRTAAYKHQFHRLVNHYMATEALKAQRDVDKKRTYMEGFSKRNKKFPSIEAEYVDVIKSILKSVNFKTGAAGKAERTAEIAALGAFIETRQEQDGALLTVPDFLLDPETNPNNNIRGMSYRRFLQLHEVIKRYDTQGRNAKRARKGEDAVELSLLTAELLTTLAARKDSFVSRFRSKSASEEGITGWKGLSFLAAVDGQLLKIEALLEAMDGSVLGPWHQSLYEPFSAAAVQSQELQLEVSDIIGELVAALPRSVKKNFGKGISPSLLGGLGKPGMRITRGNLVMLALNAGNEGNLDKVIRGLGGDVDTKVTGAGWNINEDILNTAFEQLTEEEWSLIKTVWAHAEKLWPTVDAIYRKEHGTSPDRVEPRTITTKFGDITGGYFPLMYDKTVAGASADAEQKDALQLMQAQAGRASVNSSMTKARTGYAAPVTLNINKLASSFRNTIHFVTHYEAVQNANKILNQPEIKAAVEIKVGSAYYRELRAWLAALAVNSNDTTDLGAVGEFFNQIYTNTTVAILGASYTTLGMQTLGIINGQDRILADVGYTPKNAALLQKDMAYGAMKALDGQHARWIMEASGEMRFRRDNIDQNVDEALRSLKGKTSVIPAVQRTAMQAIAQVQFYSVDMPVWTAAYNTSLRSHPNDTPRAVKYADRVIRLSQSAGALKDLSPIQRKAYLKPFLMFYTWFAAWYATQRGLGAEFGAGITKRPTAAVARAATRMFVLLALSSVGVGLVRGTLPDWEEEDPETGENRYAMLDFIRKESLSTFTGSIPVLREITSGWASGFGYSGGAGTIAFESVEALFSTVAKEVPQLFVEDEDAEVPDDETVYSDAAKKLAPYIMLLGVLRGIPAVQPNRTLGGIANLLDEVEGASPMDVLLGPPNEDELRRRLEN